jgi:hypothetical protein
MHVAPAHPARLHADENFAWTRIGFGKILEFELAIISKNKSFHGISEESVRISS